MDDEQYVYMNGMSRVWHRREDCPAAQRTRFLQKTRGDGTNILHGVPCSVCADSPTTQEEVTP